MPAPAPEEALAWLRLTLVPGVSAAMQRALLAALGPPQAALAAGHGAVAAVIGPDAARALASGPDPALLERTLAWLQGEGHHLVALGDTAYPRALLEIADPPSVLYASGRVELLNAPAFAVVGSRNATPGGSRDAEAFARALSSAGLAIVSGLALGIDAAAHRGGLEGEGSTLAVLGTGIDIVYPAAHRRLAHQIAAAGCLVSEFPLGTPSASGNFPRRNRLISGLARGVLVVEAGLPSGTLITARLALEQGRDVFAVPGSIHSTLSKGCHHLIKQGAKLVESADDILGEIGWSRAVAAPPGAARERRHPVLDAMGFAPASIDEIAERTGREPGELAGELTRLEIEGRVAELPGGRFQRLAR